MKMKPSLAIAITLFIGACSTVENKQKSLLSTIESLESLEGNQEYLSSPYVTAGNRLYMVGYQDGSFPDLGWHVQGEMGGIWDHPIKLMDGFSLQVTINEQTYCLDKAEKFINYPLANVHAFDLNEIEVKRTQFVPDNLEGMVVEYTFENVQSKELMLELDFTGFVDLTPVWLAEKLEINDGIDQIEFNNDKRVYVGQDSSNPWFVIFGSDQKSSKSEKAVCDYPRKGQGVTGTLTNSITLKPSETKSIRYFIAGSYISPEQAKSTYASLSSKPEELLIQKIDRYRQLEQTAQLEIPDKSIEQLYRWTKYNTDWLIREVPEQGRGLSAGIPDYPWWFGADNCYSLQGLLATGQHQEVLSTISLIDQLSKKVNNNGRIMHEASTNGVVFNPGNLNETPHFIYLLWKVFEWTGDQTFLEKYYPTVTAGLEWMMEDQDKDGNLYPDGPGMMEIHGLHSEMIDVVVYYQQALEAAHSMATLLGDVENGQTYAGLAEKLKSKINTEWWVGESRSYADFISTKKEAIELIEAAIVRADTINKPWAMEELAQKLEEVSTYEKGKRGYVVHHNWVVNTPLEMGIADQEKAEAALATAKQYTNRFGMYVTGIDRDQQSSESSKWKSFSYVGAVMTLPTGVQAISAAKYGKIDESYDYLKMLHNSFSYALPGSMYEVSPDYGMIAQAWNIYAVATPVINYYFGIEPDAANKRITITPRFPTEWAYGKLKNVKVGSNMVSISIEHNQTSSIYKINQTENWNLKLLPVKGNKGIVNGSETTDLSAIELDNVENVVEIFK